MSEKLVMPRVVHKVLYLLGQMLRNILDRSHASVNEFLILLEQ